MSEYEQLIQVGAMGRPRWWQLRARLRMWRLLRLIRSEYEELSPAEKQRYAVLERQVLFGNGDQT